MKTIIENGTNCSKYLFADDKQVNLKDDCIEVGDPENLDFIIGDMNSSNATLIEGVTEPDDWFGCKYNYVNDAWELCPDWIDPRETIDAVEPEDSANRKYNYIDGAWELNPDWVEPRIEE